jgi:hypothetical protein
LEVLGIRQLEESGTLELSRKENQGKALHIGSEKTYMSSGLVPARNVFANAGMESSVDKIAGVSPAAVYKKRPTK